MTLNKTTLLNELRKFSDETYSGFTAFPKNKTEAKQKWAAAYDLYASAATDVSGDIVSTKNKAGFQGALLLDDKNTPMKAAQEFENAFVAYWTGAVFAVGIPPTPAAKCPSVGGTTLWSTETTSVVTTITPNTLRSLLLPIFTDNTQKTALTQLQKIADAFHTATTTAVFVLITGLDTTPTPTGPLPITNTCTIS